MGFGSFGSFGCKPSAPAPHIVHFGSFGRIPGMQYKVHEHLGRRFRELSCYDEVCGQFWTKEELQADQEAALEDAADSEYVGGDESSVSSVEDVT